MFRSTMFMALAALAACSSEVKRDYDKGFNFAALKEYAWAMDITEKSSLMDRRAQEVLDQELKARGYAKTPKAEADFLVVYRYAQGETLRRLGPSTGIGIGLGGGGGFGGLGFGFGGGRAVEVESVEVQFLNAADQRPIWQGGTEGQVMDKEPEATTANFRKRVKDILDKFPPK